MKPKHISMKRGDIIRPIPRKRNNWMLALAIFPGFSLWPGLAAIFRGHWSQAILFLALTAFTIWAGPVGYFALWVWGIVYALKGHKMCKHWLEMRGWKELF